MSPEEQDSEIMENLWLGSGRSTVYAGQYDAVLTLGPAGAVRVDSGIRHRHADFPESNEHEAVLAGWCTSQWLAKRRVLIRAEPIVNGRRIAARILLNMGADATSIATMFSPAKQNGTAA